MAQAWCGKMEKRADGGFYYCQLLYGHKEPHNFDESLAPPKPLTKDQELESLRAQLLEARADVAALLLKLEYMADQGMKSSMYGFAGVVAMAKALREVLAKPSPGQPLLERLEKAEILGEAVKQYHSEWENPAKDLVLRKVRRDQVFEALGAWAKAKGE